MALSNDPIFAQTPKTATLAFTTSTQDTDRNPSTVLPTTLVTAGANGALVTSIIIHSEGAMTAEKFILWIQLLGTGNWHIVKSVGFTAYTQVVTNAQPNVTLVDKTDPNEAIRLAATDVLGITHHVDQESMAFAEYMDY